MSWMLVGVLRVLAILGVALILLYISCFSSVSVRPIRPRPKRVHVHRRWRLSRSGEGVVESCEMPTAAPCPVRALRRRLAQRSGPGPGRLPGGGYGRCVSVWVDTEMRLPKTLTHTCTTVRAQAPKRAGNLD